MSWFISSDVNNGYPALDTWRESWETGWTSGNGHRYPDYVWRIEESTNNGYPWIYPWFKVDQSDTGDLVIGGSQTNYPNGFTHANKGGIKDDFDDTDMAIGSITNGIGTNFSMNGALYGKIFACTSATVILALAALNDDNVIPTSERTTISQIYGANVFDCFLSCKVFPFDLSMLLYHNGLNPTSVISSEQRDIKAFGKYGLVPNVNITASTIGFYSFPPIIVNPLQAWEIEDIEYSLYLPMCGTYPLDIRGYSEVKILLYVDLIDGMGEYAVYINGQIVGTYRAMLASDVPLNTNQGRMQANMLSNLVSTAGKVAGVASGVVGAVTGGVGGALLGSAIGGALQGMTKPFSEHYSMSTPSVGGLTSVQCYPFPRVIAKIPKMFKDGYGYHETLGQNRSTAYIKLSECSGYIKCENYKTDIIVATDSEKKEIEQLMNNGVFI